MTSNYTKRWAWITVGWFTGDVLNSFNLWEDHQISSRSTPTSYVLLAPSKNIPTLAQLYMHTDARTSVVCWALLLLWKHPRCRRLCLWKISDGDQPFGTSQRIDQAGCCLYHRCRRRRRRDFVDLFLSRSHGPTLGIYTSPLLLQCCWARGK